MANKTKNKSKRKGRRQLYVTMAGVSLIPALYNSIFLSSMWDPYGRSDNLPVAVVNQDKPADLEGKTLTIGDDMVKQMTDSKALDFHVVSEKEAQKGLKEGDYYMIVTLPEDLSEKATTLLTEDPEKLKISYQTSEGKSTIAAKMSDSAVKTLQTAVSKNITETYTTAVFQSMQRLQTGMAEASSGSQQLLSGSQRLYSGTETLENGLFTLNQGTGTLAAGAGSLYGGLTRYTYGVSQLAPGAQKLSDGVTAYTDGTAQLASGAATLSQSSANLVEGGKQLSSVSEQMQPLVDGTNQLVAGMESLASSSGLSQSQRDQINQLITGLPQLQAGLEQLSASLSGAGGQVDTTSVTTALASIATQAESIRTAVATDRATSLSAVQATSTYQNLAPDQQAEISAAISQNPSSLDSQVNNILAEVSTLQMSLATISQGGAQVTALQTGVNQLVGQAQVAIPGTVTALQSLVGGLDQIHTATTEQLYPASTTIAAGVVSLQTQLAQGATQLRNGISTYTAGVDKLATGAQTLANQNDTLTSGTAQMAEGLATLDNNSSQLLSGSQSLAEGAEQLNSGAGQLAAGASDLKEGASSLTDGVDSLASALDKADKQLSLVSVSDNNAKAVASPVKTKKTDKDKVATNGVGLAPYMMSVSLMVLGLSANVLFAKGLDGKDFDNRWAWAKSKLLINGSLATASAFILYGAVRLVGVEPVHPLQTLAFLLLIAWTLMALVTALTGWSSRYGSFIALILLLLQLGSSAGTYPIELSPKFFGMIQPYLPITYGVSGLRQTISMTGDIGRQTTVLALFLIAFCGLGLLLYRREKEQ
ncbi:YhgE/Pip family protein [Streptococcus ruminantium]|uniref:YhgE/Pip family protein n=1 Tax=Streptococcus ruminantium TaxID=1917441 RepID=UPI0012DC897C|nr:YhgE/Pip domain-containing protein [Streptococcus ruminantium]